MRIFTARLGRKWERERSLRKTIWFPEMSDWLSEKSDWLPEMSGWLPEMSGWLPEMVRRRTPQNAATAF